MSREKERINNFKSKTMKLLNTNESRLMGSDYFVIMVSLLTAALIMLPLFMSAKSRGNEIPEAVKMEDSLSFRYVTCTRAAIVFTTHELGKCNLSVETKDGKETLYSENIRTIGKSARVFDFLNLEDGAYKIVAKKNGKTLERAFTIKGGELIYNGRVVVDPIFKTSGTRAIIELPNEHGKQVMFDRHFSCYLLTFQQGKVMVIHREQMLFRQECRFYMCVCCRLRLQLGIGH